MPEDITDNLPTVYKPTLREELQSKDGLDRIIFVLGGTMTGYLILSFWVVFFIQFILYQLFIGPIVINSNPVEVSALWSSIFTIQDGMELYLWTYITSIFSHGGVIHVLLNSIVLFSFGLVIENDIGRKRLFKFFVIAGLVSGISQLLAVNLADLGLLPIYDMSREFMFLGASGAISGIIGMVVVKVPNIEAKIIFFPFFEFKLLSGIIVFILGSMSLVLYFGVGAFSIAHIAHVSGILFGMLYGFKEYDRKRIKTTLRSYIDTLSSV